MNKKHNSNGDNIVHVYSQQRLIIASSENLTTKKWKFIIYSQEIKTLYNGRLRDEGNDLHLEGKYQVFIIQFIPLLWTLNRLMTAENGHYPPNYILLTSLPAFSTLYIISECTHFLYFSVLQSFHERAFSAKLMLPLLLSFILHHPLLSTAVKKAEQIAGSFICRALLIKEFQLYRKEYMVCLGNKSWTGGGIRSLYHGQREFSGPTRRNFYKMFTNNFKCAEQGDP